MKIIIRKFYKIHTYTLVNTLVIKCKVGNNYIVNKLFNNFNYCNDILLYEFRLFLDKYLCLLYTYCLAPIHNYYKKNIFYYS